MNDILLKELLNASSPVLLGIALMVLLSALRATPQFPNWLLPFTSLALGTLLYPVLEGFTARNFLLGLVIGGFPVGLHQAGRQLRNRKEEVARGDTEWLSKDQIRIAIAILNVGLWTLGIGLLCACASFKCTQTDYSDEKTKTRTITTIVKTRTFWASDSDLAKLKASQTDKTQTLGIGALSSEAAAGTNTVEALDRLLSILRLLKP